MGCRPKTRSGMQSPNPIFYSPPKSAIVGWDLCLRSIMDVKEAVKAAKVYVSNLFSEEGVENLGLEEVEYDDLGGDWVVTVGFSRPWNNRPTGLLTATLGGDFKRDYKLVRIHDMDGSVKSVKRWKPQD